ncbi:unnamed protein product [Rotaria sp. Silwood1]|nr:unnamed protein product [Rotaria sp. Silwood1]CAF1670140.1 unnamed protein product [Rotaria sp. Silwood1]
MLSQREYEKLKWQLKNIPSTIKGRPRQNLRTTLRKKIHEHELASTYPTFTPSNFQQFFINFQTTDLTLLHLIEACAASTNFILDTESVGIYRGPNKPALIQIQIILPTSISYVLIIEVCHLPPIHETTFQLIKQFFTTLFSSGKTIYIWGEIDELNDFTTTGLFTLDQIKLSNNNNFQDEFKDYWTKKHSHQTRSQRSTNELPCQCESCLGINPTDTWSLQNAVAYELHQWLDKRFTRSSFDIGLDPQLYHFNTNEIEHRTQLTQNIIEQQPTIIDVEQISSDESEPEREPQQYNLLSEEERKRIHNRSCTLKQRKRYYQNKIIINNIDRRFKIKQIKAIIRSYDVPFFAVNFSTSSTTRQRSLHIGIRDLSQIEHCHNCIKHLFTTSHFNEFISSQRNRSSYKDDRTRRSE